ncbi:MAG: IclR family transcriptional regulator [Acidovorax sp.]|uniref:IclR family transcriptional regulator n=1 Tax=Acidovorax sp. TaxID=1872122 RepID=UPI0039189970
MPPKSAPLKDNTKADAKPVKGVRLRPVPAVSRSIAILRLLGDNKAGMGVKAIADTLDLVPSTCLHILRVLVAEELVHVDPASKRYSLAGGMIALARSVLAGSGFAQLAQSALDKIASTFSVTAMGVEVTPKQSVVVLALSKSSQPFRLHTDVGSQFNHLASATGRLIAACGDENWTQLRKKFQAIQWDKAPSFDTWKEEVELARVQGWSVDRDNFIGGLTVVAVPIFDASRRLTHTLVAAGLSSQLNPATTVKVAQAMQYEAKAVADLMLARGG